MNMRHLALVGLTLVAILIVVAFYFLIKTPAPAIIETATTTTEVFHCDNDAKLCPDGSTVLREGAQCEFAACPSIYGEEGDWRTISDEVLEADFSYPVALGTEYISPHVWPPTFSPATAADCQDDPESATTTTQVTFNSINYCIAETSDAAAGSTYTTYAVTFPKGDRPITMHFVLRKVQCANFDGSEQSACAAAQKEFKVVELVDAIRATIK